MIRFLKRLASFLGGSRADPLAYRQLVGDQEWISRFLFSDHHFVRSSGRVKHHAFSPRNGEVSVFRIDDLPAHEIFRLGRQIAGSGRIDELKARADLKTIEVRSAKLDVASAPRIHQRHANIVGWPGEKERIRALTMELARHARLRLPQTTAEA